MILPFRAADVSMNAPPPFPHAKWPCITSNSSHLFYPGPKGCFLWQHITSWGHILGQRLRASQHCGTSTLEVNSSRWAGSSWVAPSRASGEAGPQAGLRQRMPAPAVHTPAHAQRPQRPVIPQPDCKQADSRKRLWRIPWFYHEPGQNLTIQNKGTTAWAAQIIKFK